MSEMVERVAGAIREADVGFAIQLVRLVDGERTYELRINGDPEIREFPGYEEAYEFISSRKDDAKARAAIEAMRDPSMAMIEAGTAEHYADGEREFVAGWRASIAAALK